MVSAHKNCIMLLLCNSLRLRSDWVHLTTRAFTFLVSVYQEGRAAVVRPALAMKIQKLQTNMPTKQVQQALHKENTIQLQGPPVRENQEIWK